MNQYFGLLFARPSFFEGVSRVIDLGNTMSEYNTSLTPVQADNLAINADLDALRYDLAKARQELQAAEQTRSDGE
jgi:uncharacterized protein (DUF3084 family)